MSNTINRAAEAKFELERRAHNKSDKANFKTARNEEFRGMTRKQLDAELGAKVEVENETKDTQAVPTRTKKTKKVTVDAIAKVAKRKPVTSGDLFKALIAKGGLAHAYKVYGQIKRGEITARKALA